MNTTIFHLRKHVENKLGSLDTAVGDHSHKLDMLDQSIRSLERQVGIITIYTISPQQKFYKNFKNEFINMTVSRESSVKEIEMSQLRQSFLTLSENAELLEHDFKKSQLEATMTNEKTKTEIQALENDISNKRALVQTQIESIENMLKHLATIPQTNAETHPHPSMFKSNFQLITSSFSTVEEYNFDINENFGVDL